MKKEQKILKFKKVQIAALKSATIKGGKNSEEKYCLESLLQCSQSIGTGETTSMLTNDCHVDL